MKHPIDRVLWVPRDTLKPNDYNPNAVAPPELKLLRLSIVEDGWTQPIVVNPDGTIVDGFHRWTVSADLDSSDVPVVVLARKSRSDRQISTVRHNRARGTHAVLKMADIVGGMVESGMPLEEICRRLGMEPEEVVRLSNRKGIPKTKIVVNSEWSKAWVPD